MVLSRLAVGRAVGGAQVGPVDIGAKFFAAHGPICCALDLDAALGRHLANAGLPLVDQRRRDAEALGQCDPRFMLGGVLLDVHAHMVANRFQVRNSDSRVLG